MDQKYVCLVPRNLEKEDTVSIGRFEITWKQIAYLAVGGVGTYAACMTGLPIAAKIVLSTASFATSAVAGFIKVKGSTLDEIAINSLIYTQRKVYYNKLSREGGLNVTIGAKKEDSTVDTTRQTFTVSTAS